MILIDLPPAINELLTRLKASPRLVAHLRLVHDVSACLVERLSKRFPTLKYDQSAVMFGAATHDIGKVQYPNELTGHGNRHEEAGRALLVQAGFPLELARFAVTHGQKRDESLNLEDILVQTADTIWKRKRVSSLEKDLINYVMKELQVPEWEAFTAIDDILTELAADADARLGWQFEHPV